MKLAYLDGPALRGALIAACDHVQGRRAELNRINVFPVPDGDTGTNFALTARSIADRLLASGRVGRGRALLGTLLDIKPILGLDSDGRVAPLARVRGRRQLLPRVMELLAERVPPGAKVRFGVVHVACEEVLDEVASALRERYGEEAEILTGPASPVLATHIGPGGWGLAYMIEDG